MGHEDQLVVHVAVASRMVAMGVTVASLALGSMIHGFEIIDEWSVKGGGPSFFTSLLKRP